MTAASRSLATALWEARFASGLLPQRYTTPRDTTPQFGKPQHRPADCNNQFGKRGRTSSKGLGQDRANTAGDQPVRFPTTRLLRDQFYSGRRRSV
jgi:hypothetical protein